MIRMRQIPLCPPFFKGGTISKGEGIKDGNQKVQVCHSKNSGFPFPSLKKRG